MAWIKVEHHTPDKPEVLRIAAALRISPAEAFLDVFRLWCWADVNGIKGKVEGMDYETLDAMRGRPGLCTAMEGQGWLRKTTTAIVFPKWDSHNGESAKQRAQTARRASRFRNAGRNGPGVTKGAPTRQTEQSNQTEQKTQNSALQAANAPDLPACLRAIGIGEPALTPLGQAPKGTVARAAAVWGEILADPTVRDPHGLLVDKLKTEWGVVVPKGKRLRPEDALANGALHRLRDQHRRTQR